MGGAGELIPEADADPGAPTGPLADEMLRRSRQTIVPAIGEDGAARIAAARVAVVGAGGLGSPVLLYLAAAGIGAVTVIDDDVVEQSNLGRQILHGVGDLGRRKVDRAAEAIAALAPLCEVTRVGSRLTDDSAHATLGGHDVVVDASDNFDTRFLLDASCECLGIPLVFGAVSGTTGSVTVFHAPPAHTRLRDLFPQVPDPRRYVSPEQAGVLGVLCGQVGATMAAEVVKLVVGTGHPLSGRLLHIDAWRARMTELPLLRSDRPEAAHPDKETP